MKGELFMIPIPLQLWWWYDVYSPTWAGVPAAPEDAPPPAVGGGY